MSEHSKILKSSSGIAAATFMCRVLGLLREVFIAKYLGGGSVATAWQLAFSIPNLFRRIFGEGALGTALMPLISHTLEKDGVGKARADFTAISIILGVILAATCVVVGAASAIIAPFVSDVPRVYLTFKLLPVLMPYALFICLIGAFSSVLNSLKIFFLPALSTLSLNICLLACLVFVCPLLLNRQTDMLYCLSWSVILSGVIQFVMMVILLYRHGMGFDFARNNLWNPAAFSELWRMILPGMLGASFLQISFIVDRMIACYIGPHAVPALTYSDRIIDLPIGIFAISFGAVALSNLSKSAAKKDFAAMSSALNFALRHVLFLCVPMAVFTFFFAVPILKVFYMRGKFGELELQETAWAMYFFAWGVPFFCASKIVVTGFYARKDMRTPVIVSVSCIILNIILNLILMWFLRQGGIALSTVIASVVNNVVLLFLLRKNLVGFRTSGLIKTLFLSALISLVSVAGAMFVYHTAAHVDVGWLGHVFKDLFPLLVAGVVFLVVYGAGALLFRCREIPELAALFRRHDAANAS